MILGFEIFWFQLQISLYWFMYALSFLWGYYLLKKSKRFTSQELESLFFYVFAGVILWGRIGYILFYNLPYYLENPLKMLFVWEWGMSFHGGLIGVSIAMYLFARKWKYNFFKLSDELARIIPLGLFLGRLGNYFNKELLWFPYSWPLAVKTPDGSFFPSPLLEAFLEGICLFLFLNWIYKKKHFDGQIASLFLIGYGILRIFTEIFVRTPDAQIGYIFPHISLGTLLSSVMIVIGGWVYLKLRKD